MKRCWSLFLALFVLLCAPSVGVADVYSFGINIVFDAGVAESYKAAFYDAAAFWESNITGYRTQEAGLGLAGVSIQASVPVIDGVGGILGSAGPTAGLFVNDLQLEGDAGVSDVLYATGGSMQFDSADVDQLILGGSWEQVIRHEMAHVLGFGTLWGYAANGTTYNDFYVSGSGEYTGAGGLAAYMTEFDSGATYVPVELGGGAGTANGHWNEVDSGAGLTGITNANGDDMAYELMTGWLNTPTFLSQTTLGQFSDMGYSVIPEPATFVILVMGSVGFFGVRRFFPV